MKTKLAALIVALLSVCLVMRPSAMAIGITIEIGDRPYYTDGPSFWDDGYLWVWIPGHWNEHHVWIHGHYVREGVFHAEHREHHRHHNDKDHDDHHDKDHDDHHDKDHDHHDKNHGH